MMLRAGWLAVVAVLAASCPAAAGEVRWNLWNDPQKDLIREAEPKPASRQPSPPQPASTPKPAEAVKETAVVSPPQPAPPPAPAAPPEASSKVTAPEGKPASPHPVPAKSEASQGTASAPLPAPQVSEAAAIVTATLPGPKVPVASSSVQPPAREENGKAGIRQEYVISEGDVLDISVWQDPALTRTVVVRPDGKISFPLAGELDASGKTVTGLKDELARSLSRYVTDLVLSVEVKQINSMVIYVIGRVNSPGRFPVASNVNVLQALSMAGGFNPFASKDAVRIFRQEGEKTVVLFFRYSDVAEGRNFEGNILLKRGDVVVVP